MVDTGYEVILPTTGKKVLVRGLTLREELAIQKTSLVAEESLLVKTLRISNVAFECINNKDLFENNFNKFLDSITESDLNSIIFGIIYTTYGKQLPVTYTCKNEVKEKQNEKLSDEDKEEITQGRLSGKADLDKVKLDGSVNLEGKPYTLKTQTLKDDAIIFTYAPFQFISDYLAALAYLQALGITNAQDTQTLPKENVERISFNSKVITVRTLSLNGEVKIRPSHDTPEELATWFNSIFDMCQELPAKEVKLIKLDTNPYTVDFKTPVMCKRCRQKHDVAIDCLQRLIDLATE